jgi:hypothetical protein
LVRIERQLLVTVTMLSKFEIRYAPLPILSHGVGVGWVFSIYILVLGLNGGRIIRGRIIPSNTVSYDEGVINTCIIGKFSFKLVK